jgi:outer membrane protein assembly factor BamE
LLTDMFHNDRWDYLFYFKRGATEVVQQRELIVYFDGDKLVRWTGAENLPSELELLAEIDGDKRSAKSLAAERKAKAAAAASAAAANAAAVAAPVAAASASVAPMADGSNSTSGSFGLRSPAAPIGASAVSTDHTSQQFALPTQAPANALSGGLSN